MIRTALIMIILLPSLLSASETEHRKSKTLTLDVVVNAAKKSFPGLLSTEQRKQVAAGESLQQKAVLILY